LELAAKAVLRLMAVEYPHEHDVGEALDIVQDRLPSPLRNDLSKLRELLTKTPRESP